MIDGVGEKTIKDIKRVYPDEESLISALIADKVPLLDNIVLQLREFYGIRQ